MPRLTRLAPSLVVAITACGGHGASSPDAGHSGDAPNGADGATCTSSSVALVQAPADVLILADQSASMGLLEKLVTMQQGITMALDHAAFDNLSLGLETFPASSVSASACLVAATGGLITQEVCGVEATPIVPLTDASTLKSSDGSGPRHDILATFDDNATPIVDPSDSAPVYDAFRTAIAAVQAGTGSRHAIIFLTDGGFSCTDLSSPLRPGYSDGECPSWEVPPTLDTMIVQAAMSTTAAVLTGVIGLPGSNSDGGMQGTYPTPPYSMELALSTLAVQGNPAAFTAATCDATATFTEAGAAPAQPCHFDLANAAAFSAAEVAQAVADARSQTIGCVYTRPSGDDALDHGGAVKLTLDGTTTVVAPSNAGACAAAGCYIADDATVTILGAACLAIGRATATTVSLACD